MGKPWVSLYEQELDDLCLDDEAGTEGQQKLSTRPLCLSGPVHEVLLVVIAAFTGASFSLLQRATMVLTDTVRHSLLLDMSDVSWMSASSGLTAAIFLLPIAHIADRCPNISRKAILISTMILFSLTMGLTALNTNGVVLDIVLGVAGLACAAHIPIMSSLLASIYAYPSTRRHCVLTFFLAGGNAFSIILGSVGCGLVNMAMNGDWRGSFVYIAIVYGVVAVVAALVIPNVPRTHSVTNIRSRSEDRYTLLGHPVVKRSSWADWWPILKSVDWIGLLIIFTGVACLSASLSMAALSQAVAGGLLLSLHPESNYFAIFFPSLILSALGMDWGRNVVAFLGTSLLQIVNRLAIPLGIGITSAIWSSTPKNSVTNLSIGPIVGLQPPYFHVFIATLSFAAIAVVVAPFARLGKLGVASTATDPSLPHVDTGLKTLNLDGGGDQEDFLEKETSGPQKSSLKRYKVQPRNSSLLGTSFNAPRRTSTSAASFQLPRIGDSRASDGLGIGFGISDNDDSSPQRTSTAAMTERVIWLVCEDCGASKRIVEPIGDPERYFYDSDGYREVKKITQDKTLTPSEPSSKYSSVSPEVEASVVEVGVVVDRRRFALVNRPEPKLGSFAEEDEG
ncbi:hypothetical protein N0V82_002689 [Gnomoniopsis sp. IMI 355080]|nr:hypothetical protein N0V82_002689 [Gnomoniopsis sp. IMI 355080]